MSGKPYAPNEYDVLVGRMLATTRIMFGLSQKDLATKTGITFQQIQKYETAGNRLSVSRLHQIVTECFDMTISEFFGEINQQYNHNPVLTDIVRRLYNMNPAGQKLMAQFAECVQQTYPKSATD